MHVYMSIYAYDIISEKILDMHTYLYIRKDTNLYIYIYTYIHIYIFSHKYKYIYIFTYMHIVTFVLGGLNCAKQMGVSQC